MNSPSGSGTRSSLAFLLSVGTLTLVFLASFLCASDPLFRAMMKLSRQADLMSQRYVGDLSPERVFADAWKGMQAAIPFHVELIADNGTVTPDKKLGEWGLLLASDREGTSVVAVTEGSLFRGSLRPGDKLTSVGEDTARLIDRLKQHLTSRVGDSLSLTVERDGMVETVRVVVPALPARIPATVSRIDEFLYCGIVVMVRQLSGSLSDSIRTHIDAETRGIIVDLRNCRDGSEEEVERVAKVLSDLDPPRPLAVLVDQSTGFQGAGLARMLSRCDKTAIAGNLDQLLPVVTETIPLRTGERLLVYREEARQDFHNARDAHLDDSSRALRIRHGSQKNLTIPQITCEPPELSAMTLEMMNRGLMLDFVAASSYRKLPTPQEETKLFEDFTAFLHSRGYFYDPLGEAFRQLAASARRPNTLSAMRNIRQILDSQPPVSLDQFRGEIVPLLLLHLQEVKIGGEPTAVDRLRMDDYCLKAALDYLRGLPS